MSFEDYEKRKETLKGFVIEHKIPISYFDRSGKCFTSTQNPAGVHSTDYRKGGYIFREFRVTENFEAIIEDIHIVEDNVRHGNASIGCDTFYHLGSYVFLLVDEGDIIDLPIDIYEEMFINEMGYAISHRPRRVFRREHIEHGDGSMSDIRYEYELSICGKFVVQRTYTEYVGLPDPNNNWQVDGYRGYSDIPRVFKFPNNSGKIKEV